MDDKNFITELWLKLRADIVEFHEGMIAAAADMKTFTAKLGASHAEMQKFGRGLGVVSLAMAAFGGLAVKTFADFEQSMANTFSVLSATGAEMQKMSKYAREMGQTTIFKAKDVANAMYFLASAGYNAQQTIDALKGTLNLAASTQHDLADTTRIVVNTLNAFGLQAGEATRVSNVFAASIAASQAEMDKIGASMEYVAPIASALGISLEQTTAALGELYDSGIDASTAGTNMRQAFVKLINPTKDAREALDKLGLKVSDVSPQVKDLIGIVKAFEDAGAGAKDKTDELAKIFDVRAMNAMQILIQKGSDALADMERKITGTTKASEMAKIQLNTFTGSLKMLIASATEMMIVIGERLAPVLRSFGETITSLIRYFNKLTPGFQLLLVTIPAVTTVLGLLLSPIALLIGFIPKIVAGLGVIKVALTGATGATLGWVTVILAAVAAIGYLYSASQKTENSLGDLFSKMKDYNSALVRQKENQINLIDSYLTLANKINKTSDETNKQRLLFDKIKALYPELISGADNYKNAQNKLTTASSNLKGELKELYAQQVKIRELELRVETTKLKKDFRELNDEMKNTSLGFWQSVKAGARLLGDTSGVELEMTKERFDELATSAEGLSRLESGFDLSTKGLDIAETKLAEIKASITDISNRSDLTELGKKAELETLRQQESVMQNQVNNLDNMVSAYSGALEKGKQLLTIDNNIKNNQIELNKLKGDTGEPKTKESVDIVIPSDLDDKEVETQRKLNDLIFSIKKNRLEAEMNVLKLTKEKELNTALQYAAKEDELARKQIENEKADALITAKETGASVSDINLAFKEKEIAQEKVYQFNIDAIKKQFRDKDLKEEWNRISSNETINQSELINYQAMLHNKLSSLEKWSDDYTAALLEIKKINEMISVPEQQKLKFGIEMSNYGNDTDAQMLALQNYKEFLDGKIELESEYTDKWYGFVSERARVEQEMIDIQMENIKIYFDNFMNIVDAGLNQMAEEWLIVSRKAKSQLDAIWIAVENAAIRAITNIVQAEITKMFVKLLFKIADFLLPGSGTMAGVIMEGVDMPGFDASSTADTGGVVKRGGMIRVKPQEVVVPGEVVRATRDKYAGALVGEAKPAVQTVENNHNYFLVNPMVDDQGFWENVMENKLTPIQERIDKKYGKKR